MKKIFFLILIGLSINLSAQDTELKWLVDFEIAKKESKTSKKPILMYFTGSDWCAPCKLLKADFFSTQKFKEQAEHLVLLKVDIPRRNDIISQNQLIKNKKLVSKYNKEKGFPLVLMLNHRGKVIGNQGSYSSSLRDPSRYFNFVAAAID